MIFIQIGCFIYKKNSGLVHMISAPRNIFYLIQKWVQILYDVKKMYSYQLRRISGYYYILGIFWNVIL